MSETYDLFQKGRDHLKQGMPAQATVSLEKAKRREPDKASIREALGIGGADADVPHARVSGIFFGAPALLCDIDAIAVGILDADLGVAAVLVVPGAACKEGAFGVHPWQGPGGDAVLVLIRVA